MSENRAEHQQNSYEKRVVNVKMIIGISIIGIIILVVMLMLLNDFFVMEKEAAIYNTVLSQTSKELEELHIMEFEKLNSYKVIDDKKGVYQIPIKRAMQLLAE